MLDLHGQRARMVHSPPQVVHECTGPRPRITDPHWKAIPTLVVIQTDAQVSISSHATHIWFVAARADFHPRLEPIAGGQTH